MGVDKNGLPFSTFQFANGVENARAIAGHVSGSLKRRTGGLDGLAKGNIGKIVHTRQYRGIDFSTSTAEKAYGYAPYPNSNRNN